MGARDGPCGQYRAGRSAADVERSLGCRQLCEPFAGCLGRVDELGNAGIRRRIGLRQHFHDARRPQRRNVRRVVGRLGHDRISVDLAQCLVGGRHDTERLQRRQLYLGNTVEPERHRHEPIRAATSLAGKCDERSGPRICWAHHARRRVQRQPVDRRRCLRFSPLQRAVGLVFRRRYQRRCAIMGRPGCGRRPGPGVKRSRVALKRAGEPLSDFKL